MDINKTGYKQGLLSAYFGILPRSRQNNKGHEARVAWLNKHFEGLEIVPSGSQYVAALPNTYKFDIQPIDFLELLIGARMKIVVDRMEMKSDSLQESVGKLHNAVLSHAMTLQGLTIYIPKEGQSSEVIVPGKEYLCIKQDDPLHDHNSTDLIDFASVNVTRTLQRVSRMPYNLRHSHLMDPKLAP